MRDEQKVFDSLAETQIKEYKSNRNFFIIIAITVALMIFVLVLNSYVFLIVQVNGSSMNPTLYGGRLNFEGEYENGDSLLVNRKKDLKYGSIIVVSGEKKYWIIKRLIAMPGDTVEIKDGKVFRNEECLDESQYLADTVKTEAKGSKSVWVLGEDEYFYLGDNRPVSADSRYDDNGTCSRSQIVGVVEEWSLNHKRFFTKLSNFLNLTNVIKD